MMTLAHLLGKEVFLGLYLFVIPCLIHGQASVSEQKLNTFLKVAEELFHKAELSGAGIAIVQNQEIVYTGGFGFADREQQRAVDENSLFFIGSTTKAFTGFAAARLVEKGLLDWKEPIINYLPNFTLSEPYVARHINLEDLFTHMSGLEQKDELWLDKDISREEVYQQTASLPFAHSFRSNWHYSNHAYVIIAKVMEAVSGKSWEALIQEEIFRALDMNSSYVSHQDFLNDSQHVSGYFGDGLTPRPHSNSDNIAPAGGISSTPKDIAKWLQMQVNQGVVAGQPLLAKETFDYLIGPKGMSFTDTCSVQYYSIGWGGLMEAGRRTLRHSGAIAGNNARVSIMPDDGFGIFIMTNQRSEYKGILTNYAESIFVKGDFVRDTLRENKMINLNRFIHFQVLLLNHGIEAAREYHAKLQYKDFELDMAHLGQYLMEQGYPEPALFVFELNHTDHPYSYEACYNYAAALAKQGGKTKAIELYRKALEINPENDTAKKELEQLLKNE